MKLHCPVFSPIPKKGNAKECSNYRTIALISHASKVMFNILQARLQQYVYRELPDIQADFRNVRTVIKMLITKKKERRKEWREGRKERRKEESKRRSPRTITIPQVPGNPLSLVLGTAV